MSLEPITDETTRLMRLAWFRFLDTVEPFRQDLHRYCLRLTRNLWSAEDLVQDTLLRGYAAIARGDLHGETSKMCNRRAYLFRTASNLWIDQVRHARLEAGAEDEPTPAQSNAEMSVSVRDAGARLFEAAAPQERAALVLKEVFDLTLREIADILDTSEGAVKSALHRGRARMEGAAPSPARGRRASQALLDRFVAAFNARDAAAVTALLLETVSIEVQGVGGGRGREGIWVESSLRHARGRVEVRVVSGELVVAHLYESESGTILDGLTRLEEVDGSISRIQSYSYTPETISEAAKLIGASPRHATHHQQPEVLEQMIASTALPWLV